jgi:hypothetical protein
MRTIEVNLIRHDNDRVDVEIEIINEKQPKRSRCIWLLASEARELSEKLTDALAIIDTQS